MIRLIRKIGKILRGGAGRKEIFLGTLCGVLIGFNPQFSFTVVLAILITLLLNANVSFVLLGAAVGKICCFALAGISFNTGFAIIHNLGAEAMFRKLCNAPVTALMDLNVYALVGSLPYALVIGIALGTILGSAVVRIRKKMLEADQHEIIGKTFGNKVSRFLLWLAFGKNKLALEEEVITKSSWLRKSGLVVIAVLIVVGAALEFFLLDLVVRHALESAISKTTGAEVNIAESHFSLAEGKIEIRRLQVTDPDKPTHNMFQISRLATDLDVSELLSRNYTIDLLEGSVLQRDVPRESPGAVYEEDKTKEEEKAEKEAEAGKSFDDYLANAKNWKKYGEKAYDYLKKRRMNAESTSRGESPKASKDEALVDADKEGYLNASADLVADRPAWTVRKIRIEQVQLRGDLPEQTLEADEVSSHPELNGKPTRITLTPSEAREPSVDIVLRFDDPTALHAISVNLAGIPIGDALETSDSFPVEVTEGKVDVKLDGNFSADSIKIPFSLLVHNLKANVEEGEEVMGMDSLTASEVLSSMEQFEIDGSLGGSLVSPRISIDYGKLTANMKDALVAAGKKELSNRANAEMDKAKEELKKQAGAEINKALGGEEGGSVQDKAKDAFKKLF